MSNPESYPRIVPIDAGWLVQPFGKHAPGRGQRLVRGTRDEAEAEASKVALEHALRAHAFETMVLDFVTELEKADAPLLHEDPYGWAQRLRALRMEALHEIRATVG